MYGSLTLSELDHDIGHVALAKLGNRQVAAIVFLFINEGYVKSLSEGREHHLDHELGKSLASTCALASVVGKPGMRAALLSRRCFGKLTTRVKALG